MITIINNREGLISIKPIWIELFNADINATPFQSFEYILSAIETIASARGTLHIILIKDETSGLWTAIFPLILSKKGELRFINSDHSDFCAPLIRPEFNHYNLYEEFSRYINGESKIKGILFDNICSSNQLISVLKPHFKLFICVTSDYYSTIPVYRIKNDKDYFDAFRFIKSHGKKKLRSAEKKLVDCDLRIFSESAGDEYPRWEIDKIVCKMISDGVRTTQYFSPNMLLFWQKLYKENIIEILALYQNDEIKSCNLVFVDKKHNEYIKWIMIYTESRWNLVVNILFMKYLYQKESCTINFARGIYDYKLVNFHPDVKPLFRIYISKTKSGHLKNMLKLFFFNSLAITKFPLTLIIKIKGILNRFRK